MLSLCKLLIHVSRRKLAQKSFVELKARTLRSRQWNVVWAMCSWRRDHKLPSPKLSVMAYIFSCLCDEYFIQVCYILKLGQAVGITGKIIVLPFSDGVSFYEEVQVLNNKYTGKIHAPKLRLMFSQTFKPRGRKSPVRQPSMMQSVFWGSRKCSVIESN